MFLLINFPSKTPNLAQDVFKSNIKKKKRGNVNQCHALNVVSNITGINKLLKLFWKWKENMSLDTWKLYKDSLHNLWCHYSHFALSSFLFQPRVYYRLTFIIVKFLTDASWNSEWRSNSWILHRYFLWMSSDIHATVSDDDSSLEWVLIQKMWILDQQKENFSDWFWYRKWRNKTHGARKGFTGVSGVTTQCNKLQSSKITELSFGYPK